MEKGDISEFGHLACPLAGGGMGVVGTRRQIDWATRIWGRRGFGGIERQNFFWISGRSFQGRGRFEGGVETVF